MSTGGPNSGEPSTNETLDQCDWTWDGSQWNCTSEGSNCNSSNRSEPFESGSMVGDTTTTNCSRQGETPCDDEDE